MPFLAQLRAAPNLLTLLRLFSLPFLVIAILDNHWYVAFGLMMFAGVSDGFDGLLAWVLELRRKLGIPHTLADIGVTADQSALIGSEAAIDPSAGGNPIPVDAAALERIFRAAVAGRL